MPGKFKIWFPSRYLFNCRLIVLIDDDLRNRITLTSQKICGEYSQQETFWKSHHFNLTRWRIINLLCCRFSIVNSNSQPDAKSPVRFIIRVHSKWCIYVRTVRIVRGIVMSLLTRDFGTWCSPNTQEPAVTCFSFLVLDVKFSFILVIWS